ncbi:hypothetical protein Ade02nite_18890 [Paractinoplanes deccanensis]|uniref:Uncharacterized protein n=1 Tax=Paractinoplanes deccanensis TaxID=113561 RepID=A0ABQ3XZT6_9ACTN|nr:hypothetical protein [Actinoplanes deccanensis]GID73248.1 hypothetical protein Ade02nite_18890 [Actinoplanes deccanensis]
MTTATIRPLLSGGALFELAEMTHWFPSKRDAEAEAVSRRMPYRVVEAEQPAPAVLAVSPALNP